MLTYLQGGLLTTNGMPPDLERHVQAVAECWLAAAVDPAVVEYASEAIARLASEARDGAVSVAPADVMAGLAWCDFPEAMTRWLSAALQARCDVPQLAATAVHLLDIAERLALLVFVPELPSLSARADRSGDAARRVGTARHLRG